MAPSFLKDTPELMELTIGESMKTRTNSLDKINELGPPDLCYILKTNNKINANESSYHYVLGNNASSSASLATYINKLINSVETKSNSWLTLSSWKIVNGIYCCYNVFSKVDIRVEVQIPGGVVCYMIDSSKKRCTINNDDLWNEAYISSVLRAILYDDNYIENDHDNFGIISGIKKVNVFENEEDEDEFLRVAKIIYESGKFNIGHNDEAVKPTISNNYLTQAIVKYFTNTKKQDKAIKYFQEIYKINPEIGSVISKLYFESNKGIEGVVTLHKAITGGCHSYELLITQANFLREKGRYKEALAIANKAIISSIKEFYPWELLANLYVDLNEYEKALQALNSCPMINSKKRDLSGKNFCKPVKKRIPHNENIPTIFESELHALNILYYNEENEDGLDDKFRDVHSDFLKLPGNRLYGTYRRAYNILIRILNNIGWDNLLQYRSKVFIMEEEYKLNVQFKSPESEEKIANKEKEMNKLKVKKRMQSLIRNKPKLESTNSLINQRLNKKTSKAELNKDKKENKENGIITTHITPFSEETENQKENEKAITEGVNEINLNKEKPQEINEKVKIEFDNKENAEKESKVVLKFENEEALHSKENLNINFDEENNEEENDPSQDLPRIHSYKMALTTKRLCERWLDNMFMVLYEDLRVFSLFQVEVKQPYLIKKFSYNQSSKEWELYGDLALRLGYKNEALDAYIRSFNDKYSVNCLNKILKLHTEFNQVDAALNIINQLVLVKEYNYDNAYYPNEICNSLLSLIDNFGLEIVNNIATNCSHYVLMKPYFTYLEKLNKEICEKTH
ncbi:chaps-domain-containing protein [Neocallimastix lanati (nom. inval.)]|jgi:hypothetical protein|nr:chaps-domain-containing protein [Neocallimastix sp. JGI-2020a]